jgi:hypothetical protein
MATLQGSAGPQRIVPPDALTIRAMMVSVRKLLIALVVLVPVLMLTATAIRPVAYLCDGSPGLG